MWLYVQTTGEFFDGAENHVATGYSGHGRGRNNPVYQAEKNVGPIPAGFYSIGDPRDGGHMGPYVLPLSPINHDACGRSGFFIHGDDLAHDASEGCIILGPTTRRLIGRSTDRLLHVVPSL